jgi:hypothetical protein
VPGLWTMLGRSDRGPIRRHTAAAVSEGLSALSEVSSVGPRRTRARRAGRYQSGTLDLRSVPRIVAFRFPRENVRVTGDASSASRHPYCFQAFQPLRITQTPEAGREKPEKMRRLSWRRVCRDGAQLTQWRFD